MDWINVPEERNRWCALVNVWMNTNLRTRLSSTQSDIYQKQMSH